MYRSTIKHIKGCLTKLERVEKLVGVKAVKDLIEWVDWQESYNSENYLRNESYIVIRAADMITITGNRIWWRKNLLHGHEIIYTKKFGWQDVKNVSQNDIIEFKRRKK